MQDKNVKVKGLVSCIIPTYKRSDTLLRAVNSVLAQTYDNIEVLVVDDNNPNDEYSLSTQEKIKTISDSRIRYILQKKHINGAVARNEGIKKAKGEFIAFLDDDDEWLPNKIEEQVEFLNKNLQIDGVSCLYSIKNKGEIVRVCKPYTGEQLHKKVLDRSVSVFTTTILVRRKALDEAGYFDENLLRHQDLQLLLDFLYHHNMEVIEDYLAILHSDSEINHPNVKKMIEVKCTFFDKCRKHMQKYSISEQKQILAAHYFEIVVAAIRNKNMFIAFKYILKIGINPKAYKNVVRRWKSR